MNDFLEQYPALAGVIIGGLIALIPAIVQVFSVSRIEDQKHKRELLLRKLEIKKQVIDERCTQIERNFSVLAKEFSLILKCIADLRVLFSSSPVSRDELDQLVSEKFNKVKKEVTDDLYTYGAVALSLSDKKISNSWRKISSSYFQIHVVLNRAVDSAYKMVDQKEINAEGLVTGDNNVRYDKALNEFQDAGRSLLEAINYLRLDYERPLSKN